MALWLRAACMVLMHACACGVYAFCLLGACELLREALASGRSSNGGVQLLWKLGVTIFTHPSTHSCAHTHTHTHTCPRTHAHTDIHSCTLTYMHTCACTCSNLRQYCNLVGANLEIVTEALSFVNVSYLLPLCMSGPPYDSELHSECGA